MFNLILTVVCIVSLVSVCMIAGSLYHLIDVIEEKIDDMSMLECRIAHDLPEVPDGVVCDDKLIFGQSFDPND